MEEVMKYWMDSYLPEIPKEKDFSYLKLFYLLPKLREKKEEYKFSYEIDHEEEIKDLESRILFLRDFILEKELFLSWSEDQLKSAMKEIDMTTKYGYLKGDLQVFHNKLMEATSLGKLAQVLNTMLSTLESPFGFKFLAEACGAIEPILIEKSYNKWETKEREGITGMLERILGYLPCVPTDHVLYKELVDLLFDLKSVDNPQKDYTRREDREDYLLALRWYENLRRLCDVISYPYEEKEIPYSDIESVVWMSQDQNREKLLSLIGPYYAKNLCWRFKDFVKICNKQHPDLAPEIRHKLADLTELLKPYEDINSDKWKG